MPVDEYDWLFDYVLQYLESERFDASVMDFMDEHCECFDNDEENKFIYTDIHNEFKTHVEGLIIGSLAELNVSADMFLDAVEQGRNVNNRDVNRLVLERLAAIDDFLTFKRMMVKRNMELQVEALRLYQNSKLQSKGDGSRGSRRDDSEAEMPAINTVNLNDQLPEPDELRMLKDKEFNDFEDDLAAADMLDDEELQEILQSSLLEMELLHRREELEQADLEAALAMSLALEEERIRLLRVEAKKSQVVESEFPSEASGRVAEAKEARPIDTPSKRSAGTKATNPDDSKIPATGHVKPLTSPRNQNNSSTFADPKPLRSKDLKPLPAISKMSAELEDRRKQAEELLQRNAEQFVEKRKLEEQLREQVKVVSSNAANSGKMTDAQLELEKRAKHMREQRDKIIAAKKLEREKKVLEEAARNQAANENGKPAVPNYVAEAFASANIGNDAKGTTTMVVVTDESEAKRNAMRLALARRLKMDLLESEEQKLFKQQEEQFADLDRQLQQVEQLRQENRQREMILAEQLKRQQNAIARNVKLSSTKLKEEA